MRAGSSASCWNAPAPINWPCAFGLSSRLHVRIDRMRLLADLKIRTKVLVAMLPLALMAIGAVVYSSLESQRIDAWYSNLIENYVKTFQSVTTARADTMLFRLLLYQLLAEDDPNQRLQHAAEMDNVQTEYRALLKDAERQSPERASEIKAVEALFDQSASSARLVRAAALDGD